MFASELKTVRRLGVRGVRPSFAPSVSSRLACPLPGTVSWRTAGDDDHVYHALSTNGALWVRGNADITWSTSSLPSAADLARLLDDPVAPVPPIGPQLTCHALIRSVNPSELGLDQKAPSRLFERVLADDFASNASTDARSHAAADTLTEPWSTNNHATGLMMWKALALATNSESPVVVVLS